LVTRPAVDTEVTLTATLTKGSITVTKAFEIKVKSSSTNSNPSLVLGGVVKNFYNATGENPKAPWTQSPEYYAAIKTATLSGTVGGSAGGTATVTSSLSKNDASATVVFNNFKNGANLTANGTVSVSMTITGVASIGEEFSFTGLLKPAGSVTLSYLSTDGNATSKVLDLGALPKASAGYNLPSDMEGFLHDLNAMIAGTPEDLGEFLDALCRSLVSTVRVFGEQVEGENPFETRIAPIIKAIAPNMSVSNARLFAVTDALHSGTAELEITAAKTAGSVTAAVSIEFKNYKNESDGVILNNKITMNINASTNISNLIDSWSDLMKFGPSFDEEIYYDGTTRSGITFSTLGGTQINYSAILTGTIQISGPVTGTLRFDSVGIQNNLVMIPTDMADIPMMYNGSGKVIINDDAEYTIYQIQDMLVDDAIFNNSLESKLWFRYHESQMGANFRSYKKQSDNESVISISGKIGGTMTRNMIYYKDNPSNTWHGGLVRSVTYNNFNDNGFIINGTIDTNATVTLHADYYSWDDNWVVDTGKGYFNPGKFDGKDVMLFVADRTGNYNYEPLNEVLWTSDLVKNPGKGKYIIEAGKLIKKSDFTGDYDYAHYIYSGFTGQLSGKLTFEYNGIKGELVPKDLDDGYYDLDIIINK